jgi:hypothetical protein
MSEVPLWQQVIDLFDRHGLPPPPWRLRDELVVHWDEYNKRHALHAEIATLRSQLAEAREERREDLKRAFVAGCCAVLTWTKSGMPQDDLDEAGYDYAATVALSPTTPA